MLGLVVIPASDVQTAAGTLRHFLDKSWNRLTLEDGLAMDQATGEDMIDMGKADETGGERPSRQGQMRRSLSKSEKIKHKNNLKSTAKQKVDRNCPQ